MTDETNFDKNTQLFMSLVTSMHMGAMYQLGKIASPISGQIERNLDQAQYTIDLLGMLEVRSAGNLTHEESSHLTRVLSELRMNYIDESSKPDPVASESAEATAGAGAENGAPESDVADATDATEEKSE